MSDVSPYGVTEHADAAGVTANALVGGRDAPVTANAAVGASPAMFSTAPYKPPRHDRPKVRLGPHGCRGKDGTCTVGAITGTDLCIFHTKQAEAASR